MLLPASHLNTRCIIRFIMDNSILDPKNDDFKRFALNLALNILTAKTVNTKSQVYGGMHASTHKCIRAFRKVEETKQYKRDSRFHKFCQGDELTAYFDTLRRLLVRANVESPDFIIKGRRNKTQSFIQEWYNDNQELVEEKRVAIHDLILTAFKVIWDMPRGLGEESIVDEFESDRRIVEAKEDDELLFDAVLQPAQVYNMYAVVANTKGASYNLDVLARRRLLGEEESAYRWDIVNGKYRTTMPPVSRPNRERLVSIENQIQEREERLDGVVEHIAVSADIDTICNQELRPNVENSRVCEAAFERLKYLYDGEIKYVSVQDLVNENATELIPLVMSLHRDNKVIQEKGLVLLVCRKSVLAKTLYSDPSNLEEIICTAMITFPNELNFHRRGLELLFVLQDCAEERGLLEEWYTKMVDANALDVLSTTLQTHSNHFSIVKRGLSILGNVLGGSDVVSDRENLLAHDDLQSLVNDRRDMRTIVKQVYNIQKEENREKAEDELKLLRKRCVSLIKRLTED